MMSGTMVQEGGSARGGTHCVPGAGISYWRRETSETRFGERRGASSTGMKGSSGASLGGEYDRLGWLTVCVPVTESRPYWPTGWRPPPTTASTEGADWTGQISFGCVRSRCARPFDAAPVEYISMLECRCEGDRDGDRERRLLRGESLRP